MRSGVAVITAQPAARMAGTLIGELTGRTQFDSNRPAHVAQLGNLILFGFGSQAVFSQGWLTGPDGSSMGFSSGIGASDEATDITAGAVFNRWYDGFRN